MGKKEAHETLEDWSVKDQKVIVRETDGFNLAIRLNSKLETVPDVIYNILTDPACLSIFRGIKACKERVVLEEDKRRGTRKLQVVHLALARFLFISVTFETRLHVWEDDRARTIRFEIAQEGMMKKFDGTWRVQPFTHETVDAVRHPEHAAQQQAHAHNSPAAFLSSLQHRFGWDAGAHATSSLVSLEQNILPKGVIPPGVRGLVRGMCAKQIKDMMEDLRLEVQRRNAAKDKAQATGSKSSSGAQHGAAITPSKTSTAPAAALSLLRSGSHFQSLDAWSPVNIHIKL